jgi:enoyl-CoA hydratase/carnithine racemase
MSYSDFETVKVRVEDGVAFVTIDHPPINLFDMTLIGEMDALGRTLEADDAVRVVVFESADPDFFIAHADVALIEMLPTDAGEKPTEPSLFQAMVDRYRTMPKATIAKIEGVCRGGGSEFCLSLDMRFAATGKAVLAQPEVALGIIPGGSGTQRLPRLVGRGRAMEIILGCDDFSAETAERYGYVNRALPPEELGPFVDALARRIASFPAEAIALAKQAAAAAESDPVPGLIEEAHAFTKTLSLEETRARMRKFLENGGQTRELEAKPSALGDALKKIFD